MTGRTRTRPPARRTAGSAPAPRPGPQPPACAATRVLQDAREQARLADPGLPLNQHDRRPARSDTAQGLAQDPDLSLTPADPRDRGQRAHVRMVLRPRRARPGSQPRHGHGPGGEPTPGSAVTSYSARSSPSQPVKPISCPARRPGSCPGARTTRSGPPEARPCPGRYGSPHPHRPGPGGRDHQPTSRYLRRRGRQSR